MTKSSKNSKDGRYGKADKADRLDKDMVRDRIGELVDLNKCPVCMAHADCFGNINGKCTALNDSGVCNGQGCVFYKNRDQALVENKAAFKKLVQTRRYDLINKYGKQLAALGAMDDEAMNESIEGSCDFEAYAEADYQKQMGRLEHLAELKVRGELEKLEKLEELEQLSEKVGEDV